ncbi:MAG: leucine-rich repeat domain-containing protein [Bacteroidota bacterium]
MNLSQQEVVNVTLHVTADEVVAARNWWDQLEGPWKMVFNEALFNLGPILAMPPDELLLFLKKQITVLRFAGVGALNPNTSVNLTNISGLVGLEHITYLSMSNFTIPSIKALEHHTQLEHLYFYHNQLESLQGIEKMHDLKDLYVHDNRLKDILPIKQLTNLKTAYIAGNELQSLEGITPIHAKALRQFYVYPNDDLPDSEVIRVQNQIGIMCRRQSW